jgi:prolipoprotein diacylglyceryltransferase
MHPVLLCWRGVRVHSYTALLYVGLVLGIAAAARVAPLAALDKTRVVVGILLLTIPALVGARLLFVATHWSLYRRAPRRIARRADGGAAMLGGLPLAVPASVPMLRILQLPFAPFWDVATLTLLIGLLFTRVGCLLHGCCSGRPSDSWLAMRLPDHHGVWCRRQPTQLFEMVLALLLLAGATTLAAERPPAGVVFLSVVAAYGLARALLQRLRTAQERYLGINVQVALSLGWCATASAWLLLAAFGTT